MNIDGVAEDLASDLGVDKTEVKQDLTNLIEYSVPVDEAAQSLRRKYGSNGEQTSEPAATSIVEISTGSSNVSLTARVLTSGTRSIRYQGDEQTIIEGKVADASDCINYTAWENFEFDVGDTISISNASVREWDGQPELNLGEFTSISVSEESLDVTYPIGGEKQLDELSIGDRGITIDGVVLESEQRTIEGRDGKSQILSGVIGDEYAKLPFTNWDPFEVLETGNTVRIENCYIQEFRGVPEINISEFSTVTLTERTIDIVRGGRTMTVSDAIETGGIYDLELTGNILEVRDGSGLIQRCPECSRLVQKGQCRSHGSVDPVDDLRIKAILDDGTAAVTVILDTELTEKIYGGTLEDAREEAREAMDHEAVADSIREQIVGSEFCVRGQLSVNEYGANLTATTFSKSADDPRTRARELLEVIST